MDWEEAGLSRVEFGVLKLIEEELNGMDWSIIN